MSSGAFTYELNEEGNRAKIRLKASFGQEDWVELMNYYRENVENGILSWVMDISAMNMVNSIFIGMLVALNNSVRAHEGKFQLRLPERSDVTTQIKYSQIDRLIDMNYVPVR
jgi:anti-anti-sigma regulatory factor